MRQADVDPYGAPTAPQPPQPPPPPQQGWYATPSPGWTPTPTPAAVPTPALLAAGAAVTATLLGLSVPASGFVLWRIGAWAVFAAVCAVALFAPLLRTSIGELRAWQVTAAAAAGLALAWLVFGLPRVETNSGFLLTVGAATGGLAAWLAPGRPASL